jgi:hypothetical protein
MALNENANISDYQMVKEGKLASAEQRHLNAKASFHAPILSLTWRMTSGTVSKLSQAHGVSTKTVTLLSRRTAALKDVGQVGDQTALLGDEEGASQDMRDIRSNKHTVS